MLLSVNYFKDIYYMLEKTSLVTYIVSRNLEECSILKFYVKLEAIIAYKLPSNILTMFENTNCLKPVDTIFIAIIE